MQKHIAKDTDQKALEINLNEKIYGTFAEIGAGQEVARHFFKVGAAAGTIAKTMSAYDKTFSDKIYGVEESGRYVCESRLYKMLDHEFDLMIERLASERPEDNFFVFADTVAAINYTKTIKGNGWLGVRFLLEPHGKANDLVLHVQMKDTDNQLQQNAIGILGVNMVYACFYYFLNMDLFVASLMEGLHGRIEIDMIRLEGPNFKDVDNRWLALLLVKHELTKVAIFDESPRPVHASELLYKKNLLVVRGNYRPPTMVTIDVFSSSTQQFLEQENETEEDLVVMAELSLASLRNENGTIDYDEFMARAEMLYAMGKKVIISDCPNHRDLIEYLSDYKIKNLVIVIGIRELLKMITEKYHQKQDGDLLVTFGKLFSKNMKVYAYPALTDDLEELYTLDNLPIPEGIKFLYQFLLDQELIIPVRKFNREILNIIPYGVYQMISNNKVGWEKFIPDNLAKTIKDKELFGHKNEKNGSARHTSY